MRRRYAILLAAVAVFATVPPTLQAQEQDDPPPPANLYTLHVYTNLMQFPTIVLGPDLKPMKPVPREKFDISIDGGPVFHPTKMRMEGDDPISLTVLLDAGGGQSSVLRAFAKAFEELIPGSLHPGDSVSIYAVDCTVMRSLTEEPAVNADRIARGFTAVLEAPGLHGKATRPACGYNLHLWDSINLVAQALSGSHGRRVILVVSQGYDKGSKQTVASVTDALVRGGISVFGLRDSWVYEREFQQFGGPMSHGRSFGLPGSGNDDDPLSILCANNGGMVLDSSNPGLAASLKHLIELLRGRYIIEFPRPEEKEAATHGIDITIARTTAFIRPTGGSSPIPDPAILADPNTLPGTPSPAKAGNRRRPKPQN